MENELPDSILVEAFGYARTNESLESVVAGMDAGSSDSVLAICGSGDQAFALLETAGMVLAVDDKRAQVDYFLRRAEMLRDGNYEAFLGFQAIGQKGKIFAPPRTLERMKAGLDARKKYFSAEGRLERIRKKLSLLVGDSGDIIETAVSIPGFTKIYLSNALGYPNPAEADVKGMLAQISENIDPGCLVYVANHNELVKACGSEKELMPKGLSIDAFRTARARKFNTEIPSDSGAEWMPAVYVKAA